MGHKWIYTWNVKHVIFERDQNIYFSTYSPYTCPIALPSASKPAAQKSFCLLSRPLPHPVGHHLRLSNVLERISRPSCTPLYATNTSHHKQETFIYEYPLHWVLLPTQKKKPNRTLLFGRILLKHGHHFDYWNQPLNMRMRYLDCHEDVLCFYLVIHIENVLHQLRLFYFHLRGTR
jgi:hypothetical protein